MIASDFYVGYLKLPHLLRRFVFSFVLATLLFIPIAAGLLAGRQSNPGTGQWELGQAVTMQGLLLTKPYPRLLVKVDRPENTNHPAVRTVVLVSTGKFGAGDRVLPFDQQMVEAMGYLILREGRTVLELLDEDTAITTMSQDTLDAQTRVTPPAIESLGRMALHGEIIDPKCFFGVMKPGEGKTHKSCAIRCISGGIPPFLAVRQSDGTAHYYLITDAAGRANGQSLLDFVADPILAQGQVERHGDLLWLKLEADGIRRLR